MTSASSGLLASAYPSAANRPSISSESLTFIWQPYVSTYTLPFVVGEAVTISGGRGDQSSTAFTQAAGNPGAARQTQPHKIHPKLIHRQALLTVQTDHDDIG